MFYYEKNDQYVIPGTEFYLDGVQYPPQFFNISTPEEVAAAGLVEVVYTNAPANDKYYWVSEVRNKASITYTNTPKDLDGVKASAENDIKVAAYTLLAPSDWMVIKAFETATEIPADWKAWRGEVRTYANTVVASIQSAVDVAAVEAVMSSLDWPVKA